MAEDKTETSMPSQIQFSASTSPEKQKEILGHMQKNRLDAVLTETYKKYYRLREKTEIEKQIIEDLLVVASTKLQSLGFTNPNVLLPANEQVFLTESRFPGSTSDTIGGCTDKDHCFIRLNLPTVMDMTDQDCQNAFYHELAHFITMTVFNQNWEPGITYNSKEVAHGFMRPSVDKVLMHGLDEGLPDIFAAYASESEAETVYIVETSLMMAFIEDFAIKIGTTPFEAFAQFFKANVTRDFSLQRKLRDLYGTQFIKTFNNTLTLLGRAGRDSIDSLAKLGGFYENYQTYLQRLETSKALTFEGLKGIIVYHRPKSH